MGSVCIAFPFDSYVFLNVGRTSLSFKNKTTRIKNKQHSCSVGMGDNSDTEIKRNSIRGLIWCDWYCCSFLCSFDFSLITELYFLHATFFQTYQIKFWGFSRRTSKVATSWSVRTQLQKKWSSRPSGNLLSLLPLMRIHCVKSLSHLRV